MKNIKKILIGAVAVPVLALTGGLAYASTTAGGHPAQPRPAATATTHNHAQRAGQAALYRCDWRYSGHWCHWRGHGYGHQPQPAHQRSHQHPAYRHHGYHHNHSYLGYGYQGSWGNGGSGNYGGWGHGSGSHWGNGGCCGGHGW